MPGDANASAKGAAEVKALGLPAGEFPEREGGMPVIVPGDHAIDQRRLAKVHGRRHAGKQRGLLADRFRDARHGWQRRGAKVQEIRLPWRRGSASSYGIAQPFADHFRVLDPSGTT